MALAARNNPAAAIQICEQLVKEEPGDNTSWLQLGNACYSGKRYEEAVQAYAKAARSPALAASAWYNAACSAGLKQDKEKALEIGRKIVEMRATNTAEAIRKAIANKGK